VSIREDQIWTCTVNGPLVPKGYRTNGLRLSLGSFPDLWEKGSKIPSTGLDSLRESTDGAAQS